MKTAFDALAEIALVFARNGKNLLPGAEMQLVEAKYEEYRESYNSFLLLFFDFHLKFWRQEC